LPRVFSATFPIKRFGKPIEEVQLRNTLYTGIEFGHLPGYIPLFIEVNACHAAGYRYFHDWQELTEDQKSFLIGHFISNRWVENNRSDAEYRAQERAANKGK
jgi:hypothetical protein